MVRKIKIIGRNAIERCAPSRSQKHEPNKRFQTSKGVFERRTSTGINNLRSGFPSSLFVWEAERKVFLLFSVRRFTPFPRKKNGSSEVTTGSESCTFSKCLEDKCPALTNIKAICLKIWQNHCPKNKTSPSR